MLLTLAALPARATPPDESDSPATAEPPAAAPAEPPVADAALPPPAVPAAAPTGHGQIEEVPLADSELAEVEVVTEPPDATLFLDAEAKGLTPARFSVEPGPHRIVVDRVVGYSADQAEIHAVSGRLIRIHYALAKLPPPPASVVNAREGDGSARDEAADRPPPGDHSPPRARHQHATMNRTLSALGSWGYGFGYGQGIGFGARMQAIVARSVARSQPEADDDDQDAAPGVRNELGLEFGLDYTRAGYGQTFPTTIGAISSNWDYHEVTPLVGLTWNFWLSRHLAVYPKLDLGYRFMSWSHSFTKDGAPIGLTDPALAHSDVSSLYFHGVGGIVLRHGPLAFRAEGGWAAIRFGLGVQL